MPCDILEWLNSWVMFDRVYVSLRLTSTNISILGNQHVSDRTRIPCCAAVHGGIWAVSLSRGECHASCWRFPVLGYSGQASNRLFTFQTSTLRTDVFTTAVCDHLLPSWFINFYSSGMLEVMMFSMWLSIVAVADKTRNALLHKLWLRQHAWCMYPCMAIFSCWTRQNVRRGPASTL